MIFVSNSPFDITEIINEYSDNTVERQVLEMMSTSTDEYRYDSLNILKFDLRSRKEIVNTAIALNNSELSFVVYAESRCNPIYWNRTDNGGFMLVEGAKPSDAINDIFINSSEYATECATAIIIVFYKALLNVVKENLFNKQYPKIFLMGPYSEPIIDDIITVEHVSAILLGDAAYFSNPDFDPETPQWQGENVIALPDSMFYGHGIGIKSSNEIINELNSRRKDGATVSAYITNTVDRLDVTKLADIYNGPSTRTASLIWAPFPD